MTNEAVNLGRMWYCNNGSTCYGPISIEEVRQLALRRAFGSSDLLWRKGMVGWVDATKIEELHVDSASLYELHTVPDKRINLGDILEARVSVLRNIPAQLQPYVSLNISGAELLQLRSKLSCGEDAQLALGFQLVGRPRFRDWFHCFSFDAPIRDSDSVIAKAVIAYLYLLFVLFRIGFILISFEITFIFLLVGFNRYFRWLRSGPLNLISGIFQWFPLPGFSTRFFLFAALDGNKVVISCDGKRAQFSPLQIPAAEGIWESLRITGHGGSEIVLSGVSKSYFAWLRQLAADATARLPNGAPPLGVRAPAISGVVSAPVVKVDINSAPVEALANLPGVGAVLARKALDIRENTGGFVSFENFVEAVGLKPHIIERIRALVVVGPVSEARVPEAAPKGRIVDF